MSMLNWMGRALVPIAFLLALPSCGGVKQKQPPRVADDGTGEDLASDGGDMAAPESETIEVAENDGPKETPEQKRLKCCEQCVAGLPDDKSGDPPGAIPCTKLTSKMEAGCVVWFDKNPTTGGEAQACMEEGASADGSDAGSGEEGADLD